MKLNNFKHKAVVLTAGVATLFATSCKDFLEEDLYAENSTSGLGKYVEFIGELFKMAEKVATHLGLHFYADHVAVILHEIAQEQSDDIE